MTGSRAILAGVVLFATGPAPGEDRDAKVREDRKEIGATGLWIYNDLDKGIGVARGVGKPLLVVFR